MTRPLLIHLLRMVIGYIAAVVAAAIAASLMLMALSDFSLGSEPSFILARILDALGTFAALSIFASLFIVVSAFPVWAISVLIAEWRNIRSRNMYLIAGVLAACPFLIAKSLSEPDLISFRITVLLAGLVGGYVYWRIAGRSAGTWTKTINSEGKL
jgi:hypothetical protein